MRNYRKLNQLRPTAGLLSNAKRRGFTMTELVVAATLMVAMLSLVAPLAVRSGRLWQDSRYYRLAVEELTNQLELLTSLDEVERTAAIAELSPSSQVSAALPNPVLSAETLTDEDGTRLVMRLAWDRLGDNTAVTLVGWVDPLPSASNSPLRGPKP